MLVPVRIQWKHSNYIEAIGRGLTVSIFAFLAFAPPFSSHSIVVPLR